MQQISPEQRKAEKPFFDELDAMPYSRLLKKHAELAAMLPFCVGEASHFWGRLYEHATKLLTEKGHVWGLE